MNVAEALAKGIALRGSHVVLEPLRVAHAPDLAAALAPDDDTWTYMTTSVPRTPDGMRAWIEDRQRGRTPGLGAIPFLQRDARTGTAAGSTSLFDVDERHGTGEIGFTWIAAPFRRTGLNTEAKLLLLAFAIEELGLRRVQLRTDALNLRSQRAIERLGAVKEGVLRRHLVVQDGRVRDSVVYSVIADEWPATKARLASLLRPL